MPHPSYKTDGVSEELLAALKGWQKLHADMVKAGGDLNSLPDGLIDQFALVQRELMEKTDAAIARAEAR